MALILSLESSVSQCSVALHSNGALVGLEIDRTDRSAAKSLAAMTRRLLDRTRTTPGSLEAVAVSAGPGSYTGLRIGTSLAKGFCFALGIPLISLDTLRILAEEVRIESGFRFFCPMIDARRMEVYMMVLDESQGEVMPAAAVVLTAEALLPYVESGPVLFFGNGARKVREVLSHPNVHIREGLNPSAEWMGVLACERFSQGTFEDVSGFEPRYLKEFKLAVGRNRVVES